MPIKAVTFDFWDTIVEDESDEPKRQAQGLLSKKLERRRLAWAALNAVEAIDQATVDLAYDVTHAASDLVWRQNHINWTVTQFFDVLLNGLGRKLPAADKARLIEDIGRMEVDLPPDAVPGIAAAIAELSTRYKLCIVSDTIVTPGTGLRQILDHHGVGQYFDGFAFSDEVGRSKPNRAMFDAAAEQLGVELSEIVHIGDREANDVKGPQALGAKAILFTAARADDKTGSAADAICDRASDLARTIDQLASA